MPLTQIRADVTFLQRASILNTQLFFLDLNKPEFSAALCGIGIALMDEELNETFDNLKSDDQHISMETFQEYVVTHFTTTDDADSVMVICHFFFFFTNFLWKKCFLRNHSQF